jgi:signal transduction histidine kinase
VDLCALLRRHGAARVTISTPATPIPLDPAVGAEITAAVGAALDNVRAHCGDAARAWILAENEPDRVIVTVRDDGPGIPEGRLEEAAAAGRMGVALSIRGRVADLGGNVVITSSSTGTEIEFTVPSRAGH